MKAKIGSTLKVPGIDFAFHAEVLWGHKVYNWEGVENKL